MSHRNIHSSLSIKNIPSKVITAWKERTRLAIFFDMVNN